MIKDALLRLHAISKQSADVVIDGTPAGTTLDTFEAALATFQRVSLPARKATGAPISTGRIFFLFGNNGMKVVRY